MSIFDNSKDIRSLNRIQTITDEGQLDEICQPAFADLERGNEILKMNAIQIFQNIIDSNRRDEFSKKYGENLLELLCFMCEYESNPEIQQAALICMSSCYQCSSISPKIISREQFIRFLIKERLTRTIEESNAAFNLLSIAANESSAKIEIVLRTNILDIIGSISPEIEFGQLINVILQTLTECPPQMEQICAIIMILLSSPNPINIAYGLSCIITLIRNGLGEYFDIDGFHSHLPEFLLSPSQDISSTAFDLLNYLQPTEEDMSAVLQNVANGNQTSYHAIQFLAKTHEIWESDPPPSLFLSLLSCISQSDNKIKNMTISKLLIPSLNASNADLSPDNVKVLANSLAIDENFEYIVRALLIIWNKIQSKGDHQWFIEIITENADALDDVLLSDADPGMSQLAQELLDILS